VDLTAAVTLARARAAGLALTAEGGRLHWRGPQPATELLAELRAHKAELLALPAANDAGPKQEARAQGRSGKPLERSAGMSGMSWMPDAGGGAERAAASEPWPEPPAEQVDRLARALAAPRPWQRITDPEQAMQNYFRPGALRRLRLTPPPERERMVILAEEGAQAEAMPRQT
jgi:hypothetical protein